MSAAIGLQLTYDQGQFRALSDKLADFERRQVLSQTLRAVATFLQGKMMVYPPYRYVSRREAYGVPFFTDRQRRWFFAALGSGELTLPYQRTGQLAAGWRVEDAGNSAVRLVNTVSYAGLVQLRAEQARMMGIIGWSTIDDLEDLYEGEIGRVALAVVDDWAKE